jgi:hypothetical protein
MSEVWSCGGGTQSAAIAALIVSGKLPKPDLAVIADTGREASETWRFFESVLAPELKKVGVDLVRLPHAFEGKGYNTVDIYSGKDKNTIVMPMFTSKEGSGMLPKYCSNEWKTRPVDRYIRGAGFTQGNIWIGFSIDEMERMRAFDPKSKWNHSYPLVDLKLTRGDCIALTEKMGWGTPPRSACWMCPYRSDAEWTHLKNKDPKDFARAVDLEKELQGRDEHVYFHGSCKPLDEVEFNEGQEDMFSKPCASGMCFT